METNRRKFLRLAVVMGAVLWVTSSGSAAEDAANADLAHVTLDVQGMTWPHSCVAKVSAALESVPGVRKATADFARKEAYVTVEKKALDPAALIAALKKAGYDGSVKVGPSP